MVKLSMRLDDVLQVLVGERKADDSDIKTVEDARQVIRDLEDAASVLAHLAFCAGTKL